jgi:hypothetical protein
MDFSTVTMDQVRQMDDGHLRRVIAELLGWHTVPDPWNPGCAALANPAGKIKYTGYMLEEGETAETTLQPFERPYLAVPDWPTDLNVAVELLLKEKKGAYTMDWKLEKQGKVFFVWTDDGDLVGSAVDTPARAICLAWVALELARRDQEASHEDR